MSTSKSRKSHLTTYELARLDNACKVLESAWHWRTFLVGTAESGTEYRDVDVRTILEDREFDTLFMDRQQLWELLCLSITAYLRDATGLPIDYQIQRMAEANAKYPNKPRNPLGIRDGNRFAGGGDATRFTIDVDDICQKCGHTATLHDGRDSSCAACPNSHHRFLAAARELLPQQLPDKEGNSDA